MVPKGSHQDRVGASLECCVGDDSEMVAWETTHMHHSQMMIACEGCQVGVCQTLQRSADI